MYMKKDLEYSHVLYDSYIREDLRTVITRWRLSCIPLEVELGRYKGVEKEERVCPFCNTLEDEEHAIYSCVAYKEIREQFKMLLTKNTSVRDILNPRDKDTALSVGTYLKLIEERRKSLVKQ